MVAGSTQISYFSAPAASNDGCRPIRLQHGIALLAMLHSMGRAVARSRLAYILWPEAPEDVAKARLRRLAYRVEELVGSSIFVSLGEGLALADGAVSSDLSEFRAFVQRALANEQAPLDLARDAEYWIDMTVGGILSDVQIDSDVFDGWRQELECEVKRVRARLIEMLVERYAGIGRLDEALGYARQLLDVDDLREASYVRLMRLHASRGDRAGVESAFAECATALRREFGVRPSSATEDVYLALVDGIDNAHVQASNDRFAIRYASAPSGSIAYAIGGEGERHIIVSPGFVSNIDIGLENPKIRTFLGGLAERHRVIIFDRRGVGLSERPASNATVEQLAEDLLYILDAEGVESAHIFGSSEGGLAGVRLAAQHPNRVSGLALFGTLAKGCATDGYTFALPPQAFDAWLNRLTSDWGGPAGIETFGPSVAHDPAARAWWARMVRSSVSPGAMRRILEGFRDADVRPDASRVRCPTLVMHREGDRAVRFAAGRDLALRIPSAKWVPLQGDDHWWWCGDSGAVLEVLLSFMRHRERSTAASS